MKKLIVSCLAFVTMLPFAFVIGCNSSTGTMPGVPTATATPGTYTLLQPIQQPMVLLASAANYAVLSYAGITNSGATTVCGSLGTYPSASVDGGIQVICGGVREVATGNANTAKTDLGYAYTDAAGRTGGAIIPAGGNIAGQTLYRGLYTCGGNLNVASGDLTLDGLGDANAVFIFQVTGNLVAGPGAKVILTNSAQADHVFWQVTGFCSLDTTVRFVGNVMVYQAVTMNTGARLEGRALAKTQNVTFLANQITFP